MGKLASKFAPIWIIQNRFLSIL